MKITLTDFINDNYNKLNYIGSGYNENNKEYLQFDIKNKDLIIKEVSKYNNLKIVEGYSQYAPELKKIYVTLK